MESSKRKIKLKTLDSKVFPIQVDKDIMVSQLKKIVSETTKIPIDMMRMISKARLLKDQEKLSQHISKDDETIHVMNKPPPPPNPSPPPPPSQPSQQQTEQSRPSGPSRPNQSFNNFSNNSSTFQSFSTPNGSTTISSIQIPDGDTSNIGGLIGNLLQGVVGDSGNMGSLMSNVNSLISNLNVSQRAGDATNQNSQINNTNSSSNNQSNNSSSHNPNPRVNIVRSVNLARGDNSSSIFQPPNPVLNTMPNQATSSQSQSNNRNAESNSNRPNPVANQSSRPGRFNLPYHTIYRVNQTIDNIYGMPSFPGPSLPSTTHPRNPITQMGQYLLSLNFALNRLSPLLLRTGQLLSREHFLDNSNSRRQTQRFSNYLGVAMHELSIALINVSHLYRNMTLGQNQGQFDVSTEAPQFFRPIIGQNSGARNYISFNQALSNRGFNNQRSSGQRNIRQNANNAPQNSTSENINAQASERNNNTSSETTGNNANGQQEQEEVKERIVIQVDLQQEQIVDNDEDYEDIDQDQFQDEIQEQIIDVTIPTFQQSATQNQVSTQPPPEQPTQILSPPLSSANLLSNSSPGDNNMLSTIQQALNNTPQGQIAQNMLGGMMPMINSIVSNSQGARTIGEIAANMQASQLQSQAQSQGIDVDIEEIKQEVRKEQENKSFMAKVLENLQIADIFAIINGNLGKLMHMVPKIQKIIKQQMQKNINFIDGQVDTIENRKFIVKRISQAFKIETPQSMKERVRPSYDPVLHSSHIVEREINKLLYFFMDFKKEEFGNTEQQIIEEFSLQFKLKLRSFVGQLIDQLEEVFYGGVDDVKQFLKIILTSKFQEELNEAPNGPMSMMMSNLIMGYVNTGYQQYQAERDTQRIQNRISDEQKKQGEVQQAIELNKRNSQHLLKQWKEIINRDTEIQKSQGKQRPLSRMYRTLNAFIGIGSGIMSQLQEYGVNLGMAGDQEEQKQKGKLNFLKDKMDVLERRIRSTLNTKGFEKSAVDKSFEERPIPLMLSKKYRTLLKQQIKDRAKNDPDYEQGKWERLDKLLKE